MQADEAASLATRARKDPSLTPAHLRGRWDREAAAVGLPVGDALLAAVPLLLRSLRLVGRSCGRCSTGWSTPTPGCARMGRASVRPR